MRDSEDELSDPGCWESNEERRAGFLSILAPRENEILDLIRSSVRPEVFDQLIDWLERLSFPFAMQIRDQINPDLLMEIAQNFTEPERTAACQRIASNRDTLHLLQELLLLRANGVIREMEELIKQTESELDTD